MVNIYLIIGSVGKIYAIIIAIGHGMYDCYDCIWYTHVPASDGSEVPADALYGEG